MIFHNYFKVTNGNLIELKSDPEFILQICLNPLSLQAGIHLDCGHNAGKLSPPSQSKSERGNPELHKQAITQSASASARVIAFTLLIREMQAERDLMRALRGMWGGISKYCDSTAFWPGQYEVRR